MFERKYVMVYLWLPQNDHFGHASMKLPDDTYISWWPAVKAEGGRTLEINPEENVSSSCGLPADNLPQDIAHGGDVDPQEYRVPVKDVEAIGKWWKSYIDGDKYYNFFNNNSCDVVIEGLKAGLYEGFIGNWISQHKPIDLLNKLSEYKIASVKVLNWMPYGQNVGHTSMELGSGTYISWWPEGENHARRKKAKDFLDWGEYPVILGESLAEDIAAQDGRAPTTYNVVVRCTAKIEAWWEKNKFEDFHVIGSNCCDVVINGLNAGGFTELAGENPSTPSGLARDLCLYEVPPPSCIIL